MYLARGNISMLSSTKIELGLIGGGGAPQARAQHYSVFLARSTTQNEAGLGLLRTWGFAWVALNNCVELQVDVQVQLVSRSA